MSHKIPMKKLRKRVKFAIVLVLLFNYLNVYSKNKISEVSYLINHIITDSNKTRYTVEMSFIGNSTGESSIVIPSKWANAVNTSERFKNLEVLNEEIKLLPTNTNSELKLIHAPNEKIVIKYEIISLSDDEPSSLGESRYYPIVKQDYIHWIGHTTWIVPMNLKNEFRAELKLVGFPNSWSTGSNFKTNDTKLVFNGSKSKFMASILAIGNYRKLVKETSNGLITVLVRGNWNFEDDTIINNITEIIDAQRDFWKDKSKRNFLATLIPLNSPNGSSTIDGVALDNSFAVYASESMTKVKLDYFFSHELFHHWLPHSMGQLEKEGQGLSWFVEGFTDYYASILRYRLGYLNYEGFIKNINEVLSGLTTSPYKNANNEFIAEQFFNDPLASKTLYWRGFLMALKWDQEIRKKYRGKKSLDDAMNRLLSKFKSNPKLKLDTDIITKQMRKFGIKNADRDVEKMLVGENILIDENIYSGCVDLQKTEIEVYDLGFKFNSTPTSFDFTEVDENSEAYKNGLRVDQRPMGVDFSNGDVNYLVKLKVKDGDEVKDITYRPSKKQTIPVLNIRSDIKNQTKCNLNLLEAN